MSDTASDIAPGARPAVAHGMRLQWEPAQEAHVLLYPEGMVKLNGSGVRTVADIVADLESTYKQSGLSGDVIAFIALAVQRRWLEVRP